MLSQAHANDWAAMAYLLISKFLFFICQTAQIQFILVCEANPSMHRDIRAHQKRPNWLSIGIDIGSECKCRSWRKHTHARCSLGRLTRFARAVVDAILSSSHPRQSQSRPIPFAINFTGNFSAAITLMRFLCWNFLHATARDLDVVSCSAGWIQGNDLEEQGILRKCQDLLDKCAKPSMMAAITSYRRILLASILPQNILRPRRSCLESSWMPPIKIIIQIKLNLNLAVIIQLNFTPRIITKRQSRQKQPKNKDSIFFRSFRMRLERTSFCCSREIA